MYLVVMSMIAVSCVEEILLETESFESVLVVEATITNELIHQEIKLSRSYDLGEDGPVFESNATVKVIGNNIEYIFQETEPGFYRSNSVFAAEPNVDYHLEITTNNQRHYASSTMQLTQETEIDDLYFERGFNENGEEGVSVFVNSYDPTNSSKFYRYTYDETYKIIAPRWTALDLVPIPGSACGSEFVLKTEQQLICYNTVGSNAIIIENTNVFEEDRIDQFRVRFINRNNAIISHRYSILVRQYIQSAQAHEFYKVLKNLSSNDNLFSQLQPGFLNGNIVSKTNSKENVAGFFEVSSVNEMRIYFNYSDLFPGEQLPPYFNGCTEFAPLECTPAGTSPLNQALTLGAKYFQDNDSQIDGEGPYNLVPQACGDCRVLGNNYAPDWWEE